MADRGDSAPTVRNNVGANRYELVVHDPPAVDTVAGEKVIGEKVIGFADYRIEGDRIVFPHTVIDPAMRGRGLGSVLIEGALRDVLPSGRTVVPQCWFVAEFLDLHPEYAHLR